jgi:hypothetical protein
MDQNKGLDTFRSYDFSADPPDDWEEAANIVRGEDYYQQELIEQRWTNLKSSKNSIRTYARGTQ